MGAEVEGAGAARRNSAEPLFEGEDKERTAEQATKIGGYRATDAPEMARLFFETVRSVNRADYSEEQVRAWAPGVPDVMELHARARPAAERS